MMLPLSMAALPRDETAALARQECRGAMASRRMGFEQFFDSCGEEFALVECFLDRVG
ncbi:hypothetical protein SAMN04487982_110265 [Streptomyces sp. ok210]|jgi:hypothetical protein|nr:hypothetical protein [Streptomyces sp. ok210]SFT22861.1 hypothetical protein SAMN04487982_110265 [Streptomyces sp. ok210]